MALRPVPSGAWGRRFGESLFFVSKVPFFARKFRPFFVWKGPFFAIFRIFCNKFRHFSHFFHENSQGSPKKCHFSTIFRAVREKVPFFAEFRYAKKSAIFRENFREEQARPKWCAHEDLPWVKDFNVKNEDRSFFLQIEAFVSPKANTYRKSE